MSKKLITRSAGSNNRINVLDLLAVIFSTLLSAMSWRPATIAYLLEDNQAAAAPILLDMLTAAESESRANAAWALGFVAEEITAEPLLAALSDTDAGVRSDAAGSLASFERDPRVIEALLRALSDSNEQVRISAASALGYLGDQRAIEPLKALLKITRRKFRPVVKDALERLDQS